MSAAASSNLDRFPPLIVRLLGPGFRKATARPDSCTRERKYFLVCGRGAHLPRAATRGRERFAGTAAQETREGSRMASAPTQARAPGKAGRLARSKAACTSCHKSKQLRSLLVAASGAADECLPHRSRAPASSLTCSMPVQTLRWSARPVSPLPNVGRSFPPENFAELTSTTLSDGTSNASFPRRPDRHRRRRACREESVQIRERGLTAG